MSLTQSQQAFIADNAAYAHLAAQQTGVPWQTILAQWADETGWGTSPAFIQGYNFAGVSPGGQVASYPDIASGLDAYISTLTAPIYATVRNAGAQGPVAAAQALGASPWAASHYDASGGGPGSDLVAILQQSGLDTNADTQATLTSIGGPLGPLVAPQLQNPVSGAIAGAAGGAASDVASGVVSDLVSAAKKPALQALFLVLAGALVLGGAWLAVRPTVKPALDEAEKTAGTAAVVVPK